MFMSCVQYARVSLHVILLALLEKAKLILTEDPNNSRLQSSRANILRAIYIVGLFCEHFASIVQNKACLQTLHPRFAVHVHAVMDRHSVVYIILKAYVVIENYFALSYN